MIASHWNGRNKGVGAHALRQALSFDVRSGIEIDPRGQDQDLGAQ
jgi:hypothetical protein